MLLNEIQDLCLCEPMLILITPFLHIINTMNFTIRGRLTCFVGRKKAMAIRIIFFQVQI